MIEGLSCLACGLLEDEVPYASPSSRQISPVSKPFLSSPSSPTAALHGSSSSSRGLDSGENDNNYPCKECSNSMRASVSRRNEHIASPPIRSRSSERNYRTRDRLESLGDKEEGENLQSKLDAVDLHAASSSDVMGGTGGSQHVDSERLDKPRAVHRRATSDPFDAQQLEEQDDVFEDAVMSTDEDCAEVTVLPTMPRYPVAVTQDKNCWSEPPVSIFHVRGPEYFSDRMKIESSPYLMRARGMDLFLTETPVNVAALSDGMLGGNLRKHPSLLIDFRFPWGALILYFEIPDKIAPYMDEDPSGKTAVLISQDKNLTTQEKTLAHWLIGDQEYKNERLKLIPYVTEGPWVVRNMVTGRPAIIGKKLPVSYHWHRGGCCNRSTLLECTLDIGSSSAAAKRIVSVCRRYMSSLTVDIGFVIQAQESRELPEQMLGSIRIHAVDPLKAPTL